MITPLRCGVDTLEATFFGELSPEIVEALKGCKEEAQAKDMGVEITLGRNTFHVMPKGAGLWPYVIRNDNLLIRLGTARNLPPMSVRLLAEGLASLGADRLWAQAQEIGHDLGLTARNCSRVDIALDFQGERFTFEEMLNVVCPASFRPVYPNTVNPQTFQFGKGAIVVRLYDKTAEIAGKDNRWWPFVWRLADGYHEGEPVYRAEVQLRGVALKELGYQGVDSVIAGIRELFSYGLTWCSLRTPNADSNRSRWPEEPRWAMLRTAFPPSHALGRTRPVSVLIEYDAVVKRYVSLVTSAGASTGNTDFWELSRMITTDAEQLIEREIDTTLIELVEKKRKRKYL